MAFIYIYRALKRHVAQLVDDANHIDTKSLTSEDPLTHPYKASPSKAIDPAQILGITLKHDPNDEKYYEVGWATPDDPINPHQWSFSRQIGATMCVCLIALLTTMASSIDAAILTDAAEELGVSEVAESLATGLYLV
ncbi:hypothetical protein BO70DRAFT_348690 [Aspergillus heteromorphus CBS 117.55]|uniref:MFS general substrate transporter n=1 Tax=Aspergillus heteromorphus CBS 117.55 TaxID=1448321 RepID=A0A317X5T3_9EURO|nr:uncharacterized protein BO70DRAFT_348690 [Aspergillus heteromorphus CBS 117.55]PWY92288.1 hypothetical protein BO70DRAFT_348690 [Aspergillus heteromorphus CBS 117.55]